MPRPRRKGNKLPLPDPENCKQISFFIDKDVHFLIKMDCEANDRDLSDLFREFAAHFAKKGNVHVREQGS